MQRRAEHVPGLEGNHILTRRFAVGVGVEQPAFFAGHEQCGLGRIALHFEPTVFAHELRIVAKHPGAQALGECGMFPNFHDLPIEAKVALRFVASPGHRVEFSARENFQHGHLVFGECAGFVRADHGGAAERLNGGQLADDCFPLRHPGYADGKDNGNRGGQALGNRADRERHRSHKHFGRLFAASDAHRERDRRQRKDDPQRQLAELCDFLGQRRGDFDRGGYEMGNSAGFGLIADAPHHRFCLTAGDKGAGVGKILPFGQNGVQRERISVLGHRERLASEGGFIHVQIADLEKPEIGGHAVAGLEQHHVARHELLGVDAKFASVAAHGRFGGDHLGERLNGFFGLGLLEKTDDGVDEHDAEDDRRIHPFAEKGRDADR